MPTIVDETVASAAYDTSGNGGRKIVKSNNDIVMAVKNGTSEIRLYKKPNGNSPVLLANFSVTTLTDVCIENAGNGYVGILYSHSGSTVSYRTVSVSLGTLGGIVNADLGQTAVGNVTMIANDTKTEMSMAVSTKNSTYANSFNIRFNKGTINADGSVTWGAVVQLPDAINTTGWDYKNPTLTLNKNGYPVIIADFNSGGAGCHIYRWVFNGSTWSNIADIYNGGSYAQSSPSAIFVPQEIAIKNPLFASATQGVHVVAWHGRHATHTGYDGIFTSYSTDGCVTWSVANLTVSSTDNKQRQFSTITANKNGEVFVAYQNYSDGIVSYVRNNGSWQTPVNLKTGTGLNPYPSTLFDLSINFTVPLLIYKDTSKVGFYGTWTVTTISVTQGSIGTKSDKSNLLTYAITTDGAMSEVIEKVNGAEVGRKTPTSGQSLTVGLTQAQWDSVRFGKYSDFNTISISLLENDWEQGTYSGASGNPNIPSNSTTQLRLKKPIQVKGNARYNFAISSGYNIFPIEVDSNDIVTYKGTGWLGTETYTTKPNTTKLYIVIRKSDDSTINVNSLAIGKPSITTVDSMVNNNTLTIEMGSEKWTYTFDKRLASDSDILSAVKATQDAQNTYLPAVKSKLASAVRGKGGTVNDTDSFEAMVSVLVALKVGQKLSGSMNVTGNNHSITGLPFKPSVILCRYEVSSTVYGELTYWDTTNYNELNTSSKSRQSNGAYVSSKYNDNYIVPTSNGFTANTRDFFPTKITWFAFE